MAEPQTETTTRTPHERQILRWTVIGVTIATLALALGGTSLAGWALSVRREAAASSLQSEQTTWDQADDQHRQCVTMARSRAVTIAQNEAQYEAQVRQLDAQVRFVDLIDGIIALVPESHVTQEAFGKTATERSRIAADRAQVDTDHATAVEQRPPLDETKCPPAPTGDRPT